MMVFILGHVYLCISILLSLPVYKTFRHVTIDKTSLTEFAIKTLKYNG